MAEAGYRCEMSAADFDAIPTDEEYPIDGYYEALIDRNERLGHQFFEDAEQLKQLTIGQRMLIQLGTFDSQVKNGGITQFFWNCPESIFDVGDWLEYLGVPELQANYDRALEALVGKKDRWLALREEWAKGRDNPNWETFQQTYELLDLGWFDKAYFDKHDYDEKQEWVRQARGLHHVLLTRLADYVRTHRAEFIVE
jgi:hypothetical protein